MNVSCSFKTEWKKTLLDNLKAAKLLTLPSALGVFVFSAAYSLPLILLQVWYGHSVVSVPQDQAPIRSSPLKMNKSSTGYSNSYGDDDNFSLHLNVLQNNNTFKEFRPM